MKIIKMWGYCERIIYLVGIGDKYQLFYRSSGLAGQDSKGMILPHLRLKVTSKYDVSPDGLGFGNVSGWIPKAFICGGHIDTYRSKVMDSFPESMFVYMDELSRVVIPSDIEEILDAKEINLFCSEYISSISDYVDWGKKIL